MRPWLVLTASDIAFDETVIALRRDDTAGKIAKISPTGKVPVLVDGDIRIWESLAVIEYLSEKFPDKTIWPRDVDARAHARSISSEMLAGFQPLRKACPMNLGKLFAPLNWDEDVLANVRRIEQLWRHARARFSNGGKFLFGEFSGADAMYAPVASRLKTYGFDVGDDTKAYMQAVFTHPSFVKWTREALAEPWTIDDYEDGFTVRETFERKTN